MRVGQVSKPHQRSLEVDVLLVLRTGPSITIAVACTDEGLERGQRVERLIGGRASERQARSAVDPMVVPTVGESGNELAGSRIEAHGNGQFPFSAV